MKKLKLGWNIVVIVYDIIIIALGLIAIVINIYNFFCNPLFCKTRVVLLTFSVVIVIFFIFKLIKSVKKFLSNLSTLTSTDIKLKSYGK